MWSCSIVVCSVWLKKDYTLVVGSLIGYQKPKTLGFGFWKFHGEMDIKKTSWTRDFFNFCQIFAIFDDLFIEELAKSTAKFWKIIKYAKNMAKNEEKPCSTCLKHISQRLSKIVLTFGYPIEIPDTSPVTNNSQKSAFIFSVIRQSPWLDYIAHLLTTFFRPAIKIGRLIKKDQKAHLKIFVVPFKINFF